MPTFDVVSKVSFQELNNALSNCLREINTRYDFKGLNIAIEFKEKEKQIVILAPDNMKLNQINDLFISHLVRRKLDPRIVKVKSVEDATGNSKRQTSDLQEGIDQESAKKNYNTNKSFQNKGASKNSRRRVESRWKKER